MLYVSNALASLRTGELRKHLFHEQPAAVPSANAVFVRELFESVPTVLFLLRVNQSPQTGPGSQGSQTSQSRSESQETTQ